MLDIPNYPNVCRLCFVKVAEAESISLEEKIRGDTYNNLLSIFSSSNETTDSDDFLPQTMCSSCQKRMDEFCTFQAQVSTSEAFLNAWAQLLQHKAAEPLKELLNSTEFDIESLREKLHRIGMIRNGDELIEALLSDGNRSETMDIEFEMEERLDEEFLLDEHPSQAQNSENDSQQKIDLIESNDSFDSNTEDPIEAQQNKDSENEFQKKINSIESNDTFVSNAVSQLETAGESCDHENVTSAFQMRKCDFESCGLVPIGEQTKHTKDYHRCYCKICGLVYLKPSQVQRHLLSHKPSVQNYDCELCDKVYNKEVTLKYHWRVVHGRTLLAAECEYCEQRFEIHYQMTTHRQVHKQCKFCDLDFAEYRELFKHIHMKHKDKLFHCSECGTRILGRLDYKKHMEKHRVGLDENCVRFSMIGSSVRSCRCCRKIYFNEQYLSEHKKKHFNITNIKTVHKNENKNPKPPRNKTRIEYLQMEIELVESVEENLDDEQTIMEPDYLEEEQPSTEHDYLEDSTNPIEEQTTTEHHESNSENEPDNIDWSDSNDDATTSDSAGVVRKRSCIFKSCGLIPSNKQWEHAQKFHRAYCKTCGLVFATAPQASRHFLMHQPREERVSCELCGKLIQEEKEMQAHWRDFHGKEMPNIQCVYCEERFETKAQMIAHKDEHRQCKFCSLEFTNYREMTEHTRRAHEDSLLKCTKCPRKFVAGKNYRNHLEMHRTSAFENTILFPTARWSGALCVSCDRTYYSEQYLSQHISTDHENGLRPKPRRVIKYNRRSKQELAKSERKFKCPDCDKRYSHRASRNEHWRTEHGGQKYICALCGTSFKARFMLDDHESFVHKKEYHYICEVCDKKCVSRRALYCHVKLHNSEKPFKCNHEGCTRAYRTEGDLERHTNVHTGELSFNCEHPGCNKTFAVKDLLRDHEKRHTVGKPFQCWYCEMCFKTHEYRRAHCRRIHPGEPLKTGS